MNDFDDDNNPISDDSNNTSRKNMIADISGVCLVILGVSIVFENLSASESETIVSEISNAINQQLGEFGAVIFAVMIIVIGLTLVIRHYE